MGFSVGISNSFNIGPKKNRHGWRFFRILAGSRCCYVNLPLLHRLGVGIAKVKMAGKKYGIEHVGIQSSGLTITTIAANWQALCRASFRCLAEKGLRRSDKSAAKPASFDIAQSNRRSGCKTRQLSPPVTGAPFTDLEFQHDRKKTDPRRAQGDRR
jgi:hypothetical protein